MDLNFYPSLALFPKSTTVSTVRAASMAMDSLVGQSRKAHIKLSTNLVTYKLGKVICRQHGFWTSIPITQQTNRHPRKRIHMFAHANASVDTPWVTSNSHILPKGSTFIKAVTFQYPVPPPAPTVHTHSHHEHANKMMLHVGDLRMERESMRWLFFPRWHKR